MSTDMDTTPSGHIPAIPPPPNAMRDPPFREALDGATREDGKSLSIPAAARLFALIDDVNEGRGSLLALLREAMEVGYTVEDLVRAAEAWNGTEDRR